MTGPRNGGPSLRPGGVVPICDSQTLARNVGILIWNCCRKLVNHKGPELVIKFNGAHTPKYYTDTARRYDYMRVYDIKPRFRFMYVYRIRWKFSPGKLIAFRGRSFGVFPPRVEIVSLISYIYIFRDIFLFVFCVMRSVFLFHLRIKIYEHLNSIPLLSHTCQIIMKILRWRTFKYFKSTLLLEIILYNVQAACKMFLDLFRLTLKL